MESQKEITVLREALGKAREALIETKCWLYRMDELKWADESYAPNFKKQIQNNDEAITAIDKALEGK